MSKTAKPGRRIIKTPRNPIATAIQRCWVTFSRNTNAASISPNIGRVKCRETASAKGRVAIAKNQADTPTKVQKLRKAKIPPNLFGLKVLITCPRAPLNVMRVMAKPIRLRRKTCSNGGRLSERARTTMIITEKLAVLAVIQSMP